MLDLRIGSSYGCALDNDSGGGVFDTCRKQNQIIFPFLNFVFSPLLPEATQSLEPALSIDGR